MVKDYERPNIDEMNVKQLELEYNFQNSFALACIGMGVSFMIATIASSGDTRIVLNILTFLFGFTGFALLKTQVRKTYLKLHEKYDDNYNKKTIKKNEK